MENEIFGFLKEKSQYWWSSLLIGILALVLGVWCLVTPIAALISITYVFVFVFLISGIAEISFAASNRKTYSGWGWVLAGGIIDLLFGLLLVVLPTPIVTTLLIYFVGFWILFRSIWTIGMAAELMSSSGGGWLMVLGILSLLFAILYLVSPAFGGAVILALVSVALIFYGIFRICYALQLRKINKKIKS